MKFIFFSLIFFSFFNISNADVSYKKALKNAKIDDFNEALMMCYYNYDQMNIDISKDMHLFFKNKSRNADNNKKNAPENPINLGINIEDGMEYVIFQYNRLKNILEDKRMREQNGNLLAQMQCWYDCWLMGVVKKDFYTNGMQCKELFLYNIGYLDKNKNIATEKEMDDSKKENEHCVTVYFKYKEYKITKEIETIIDRIAENVDKFDSYIITIEGFVDWEKEEHLGKVLAKQRMMYTRDVLIDSGILKNKIFGKVIDDVQISMNKEILDQLRKRVKICIRNVTDKVNYSEFVDDYNYKNLKLI